MINLCCVRGMGVLALELMELRTIKPVVSKNIRYENIDRFTGLGDCPSV